MKKHLSKKIIAGLTVACTTVGGMSLYEGQVAEAAEVDHFLLDQIVVTATKTPVSEFDAKANINVITKETIEKNHYTDLGDALKDVPGVTIQNYGSTGENYTSNSLYINGTTNVVVLVDGIRANVNGSTSSKFLASELVNMETIERIEVLKGSASTLYGSDAQGGVINIITRKPDGASKTTLSAVSGSFGKEQYNFMHTGGKDGFYWMISSQKRLGGDFKDGKGNVVPESANSTANNFTIGKKFDENSEVVLQYQTYKSDYMRPDGGANSFSKANKYGEKDNDKFSLIYDQALSENTKNRLTLFKNQNYLNDNYKQTGRWVMDLETIGIEDQITHTIGDQHTIIGGFEFYQDKINDYQSTGGNYSGKKLTNRALYVQDEWNISDDWSLTSGIRFSDHSMYGSKSAPSITAGYKPSEKVNYYVSYKEYFVAPNQSQLYSPSYGNADLKAETGHTTEAGINYKFDKTFVGTFHLFKRLGENVVSYDSSIKKYVNLADEDAKGFDIQLRKAFNANVSANVGYTYTYIKPSSASTNPNIDGYLPRGAWNIGVNYEKDKFDAALNGRGIINRDGRKSQAASSKADISTFWVWDLAMNYQMSDTTKVFAKVGNLFDEFYTDRCYDLDPDGGWYSSPGRNFQVGVTYTF